MGKDDVDIAEMIDNKIYKNIEINIPVIYDI